MQGKLVAIYTAARKGMPLVEVASAVAVAGQGLEGDRNFLKGAQADNTKHADREVTLIESEAIDGLDREAQISIQPGEARRNLVTRDVRLNELVGREFSVGDVLLRGIRLCNPCDYLERKTMPGVKAGLENRGGLRAQIVRGGAIRAGDSVRCQIDDTGV